MIGVLTMFGGVDFQPILKKAFMSEDLVFTTENCNTSVQLVDKVKAHYKESDVVIVAGTAMEMDLFPELVQEIHSIEAKLRIILILNGNESQYLERQLNEYKSLRVDIIFDDNGFDMQDLIDAVKLGRLSRQKIRPGKKDESKKEYSNRENTKKVVTQQEENKEVKHIPSFKKIEKPNKVIEREEIEKTQTIEHIRDIPVKKEQAEFERNDLPIPDELDEEKLERAVERLMGQSIETNTSNSFGDLKGKYVIGVFNTSRGAGATTVATTLAQYFALHGFETRLADLSGSNALELVKINGVKIGYGIECLDVFKRASGILVIDFGAPYEITPRGDSFKISNGYASQNIREINKCNIKVVLGFSDVWNIGKLKFFFENEQWSEFIDDSYLFLTSGSDKKLKSEYPQFNIIRRDDDYKEQILNTIYEEEN